MTGQEGFKGHPTSPTGPGRDRVDGELSTQDRAFSSGNPLLDDVGEWILQVRAGELDPAYAPDKLAKIVRRHQGTKELANPTIERGLLASVVREDEGMLEAVDLVRDEDFSEPLHRRIWKAMRTLFDRNEEINVENITHQLDLDGDLGLGGDEAIKALSHDGAAVLGAADCAALVHENGFRRHVVDAASKDALGLLQVAEILERELDHLYAGDAQEETPWPDPPAEEAFHGPVGRYARLVGEHSECDPIAVLGQVLVAFGSAVGRGPHVVLDGAQHFTNECVLIIGATSRARKGTSWKHGRLLMLQVDPAWVESCASGGLSSGEGLIQSLRDEEEGPPKDKRALCVETEFARTLVKAKAEGSILSQVMRQGWDSDDLENKTRSPLKAKNPHLSIIGHITEPDLHRRMAEEDATNGFLNRFILLRVRRTQLLAFGGGVPEDIRRAIAGELRKALDQARRLSEIGMTPEARKLWAAEYPNLSRDREGLLDPLASRAESHVRRLSLIYALASGCRQIQVEHLLAAMALWGYSERSLESLFGGRLADPLWDRILGKIRQAGPLGIARTGLHRGLGNRVRKADLDAALDHLGRQGLVRNIGQGRGATLVARRRRSKVRTANLDEVPGRSSSKFEVRSSQEERGTRLCQIAERLQAGGMTMDEAATEAVRLLQAEEGGAA